MELLWLYTGYKKVLENIPGKRKFNNNDPVAAKLLNLGFTHLHDHEFIPMLKGT